MFHSRGTVQSNATVPEGTSWISSGTYSLTMSRVARTPSPVMLRQIGKNSAQRSCNSVPRSGPSDRASARTAPLLPVTSLRPRRLPRRSREAGDHFQVLGNCHMEVPRVAWYHEDLPAVSLDQ